MLSISNAMRFLKIREKTFNLLLIGIFFLSIFSIATINYLANPFGVFPANSLVEYSGIHFNNNVRIYKTFLVKRQHVDGLILGSSRMEASMSPLPAAWPDMNTYNMAMAGASMHEMLRNLQHANAITPLKQVLIGLDFFMFSSAHKGISDFSEDYFAVTEDGVRKPETYVIRTYVNVLFSADSLKKSFEHIVKANKKKPMATNEPNGMVALTALNSTVKDNAAVYQIFDTVENTYFKKGTVWLNGPNSTYTTIKDASGANTYDDLRAMLEYIYSNNLNVTLMIPPIHGHMLQGLDGIGLWPTYLAWKKQLTLVNEQLADKYHQPVKALWDFGLVTPMTTELLPEDPQLPAHKNGMQWFWDPGHPKPAFADLIQERVFVSGTQDIGRILNSNMMDNYLAEQTEALHQYEENDPTTRKAIREKLESLNTWQWIKAEQ